MVRRASQILAVAHDRAAKLTTRAFALAPWTVNEADRAKLEGPPVAERRESGQP